MERKYKHKYRKIDLFIVYQTRTVFFFFCVFSFVFVDANIQCLRALKIKCVIFYGCGSVKNSSYEWVLTHKDLYSKRQRMHGAHMRYGLWIRFWWIYLANTVESDGVWVVEIDVSRLDDNTHTTCHPSIIIFMIWRFLIYKLWWDLGEAASYS